MGILDLSDSEYSAAAGYCQHVIISVFSNWGHYIDHTIDRKLWRIITIQPRIIIITEITLFKISQFENSKKYLCDPTAQVLCYLKMLWIAKTIYRRGYTN
jgi:hypothetical protein